MKKSASVILIFLLCISLLLSGCHAEEAQTQTQVPQPSTSCEKHTDGDNNGVCDTCYTSVLVYVDFHTVGTFSSDGTDKLTDYLKSLQVNGDHSVVLSTGNLLSDTTSVAQLNELGFSAMTVGSQDLPHLAQSDTPARFPFLAINLYDRKTNNRVESCAPSVVVEKGGIQIGIIGAVGNGYADINGTVYGKVGDELTALVKEESTRLRNSGVDFIVYLLHDGYDRTHSGAVQDVTDSQLSAYYDTALSNGYVDLVFEGGTNHSYRLQDTQGIYHLQHSHISGGISYAEIAINTANGKTSVRVTKLIDATKEPAPTRPTQSGNTAANTTSTTTLPSQGTSGSHRTDPPNSGSTGKPTNAPTGITSKPPVSSSCKKHADSDNNGTCDLCATSVLVSFDFYTINDLHGKLADTDSTIGVDELTTYLKAMRKADDNAVFLSSGDMWQGSSESNLTKGTIVTDWMNALDFTAMSLGNHEFDWGTEYIANNDNIAEFPILAINVYDRSTNKRASFCDASVMVDSDGIQIGIIGAIGDCYSSIAVDKCDDVYFKVGSELTRLVKAEADSLRARGADFIVYVIHDGYGSSNNGSVQNISSSKFASYYDTSLSNGYVDLVFEGHTHQGYIMKDESGVYHLQHRGDNKGGISHVEIVINSVTYHNYITQAELVTLSQYQSLADDPLIEQLLQKYDDILSPAQKALGYNKARRNSEYLCQLMAELYYDLGVDVWGDEYNIVLGGGFLNTRSPYYLYAGDVTYADLQAVFPFDNQLTLCSITGYNLRSKFFETKNSDYYIAYGDYGNEVRQKINNNATYYVVVDSYTANYAPNRLTIVKEYDPNIFPRDLLADYIKEGGLA